MAATAAIYKIRKRLQDLEFRLANLEKVVINNARALQDLITAMKEASNVIDEGTEHGNDKGKGDGPTPTIRGSGTGDEGPPN